MCALDDRKELLILLRVMFKFFFFFSRHILRHLWVKLHEMHFKIFQQKNSTHIHTHTL